jgi:hypothetical protein
MVVDGEELKSSQIKHAGTLDSRSSERNGYSVHCLLVERNQQDNDLRREVQVCWKRCSNLV